MDRSTRARLVAGALLLHVLLIGAAWLANDEDLSWFLHLGEASEALPAARAALGDDVAVPMVDGHDGPRFWLLARDPLLRDPDTEAGLDRPAYRARRIAYPVLAAPWRLLGEDGLLLGLVATNLLAVAGGTVLACRLADRFGARPRAGLAFALSPAVLVSVLYDLADAVAVAALLLAVVGALERRRGWMVAGAVVAALSRETMVLGLVALALLVPGLRRTDRLVAVGAGAGALAAWSWYVSTRLAAGRGEQGVIEVVPFRGWWHAWNLGWSDGDQANAVLALVVLVVAAAAVWLLVRQHNPLLAVALPYALLLPFLGAVVLGYPGNLVRAVAPIFTLLPLAVDRPPATAPPAA